MEYILKIQDQSISWYVTFREGVLISIDDGQQVYTPEHHMFKSAKWYVETLMLEQLAHYE
jgi:hypothetical protein